MTLSYRLIRRIVIALVFIAVFSFTGYGLKKAVETPPSCTDKIKNGQEEGVDCGLFACGNYCEPELDSPKIIQQKLIEAAEGDYDFVAEVQNPHEDFGASEIAYELTLFNGDNNELLKKEGTFYILPGQTKFLILTALTSEKEVSNIDFKIKSARWRKLESLEGMSFAIRRDAYKISPDGLSSTLDAVLFNDSDFDFNLVDVDVVLYNSRNEIVAVNKTDIRTFRARTERHFRTVWPFSIGETVANVEIKPSTNLFENANFIKLYGSDTPEKFQRY